jgi:hypothetical protein
MGTKRHIERQTYIFNRNRKETTGEHRDTKSVRETDTCRKTDRGLDRQR